VANEPNRAEEELKRYAAERRAQAPTELHGATRRMLQGEVARVYGGRKREEVWWKRVLLAPRFAWGVSLVTIFGISFLALQQPAPRRDREAETAAASAAKEDVSQDLTQRREEAETLRDEKKDVNLAVTPAADSVVPGAPPPVTVAPAPAPKPAPASTLNAANTPAAPEPKAETRLRKAAEPAARVEVVAATGGAAKVSAATVQQNEFFLENNISQAQMKNKDAAKAAEVLARFKLQEVGRRLVLQDADGSQYAGMVETQKMGTNLFSVRGTNRTLNQRVDFRGQYFRMAPQQSEAVLKQNQNQNQTRQAQEQLAREQVRVQGQAVVGPNNNQVQVDAQAPAATQK
jgi:hypothetical protein